MASIHKDIPIDISAHEAWDAVRDFGAVHTRLAPGFVTDAKLEDGARVVTFANGLVARELFIDCDEERRRLVYAVISERVTHYNASVQVISDGGAIGGGKARCRLIWIIDLLPHDVAPYVSSQMDQAALAMQKAFAA